MQEYTLLQLLRMNRLADIFILLEYSYLILYPRRKGNSDMI